jgi:hypothetical protein
VVEDPAIKELISKARGFNMEKPLGEPVVVMEYRGRTSEGNAIIHPRMVYADKTEYEKMFTKEVRAGFNGRTVVHEKGSNRFDCLTSIVDGASEEKRGKWVAVGRTGKDFLEKEFSNKEDIDKELPAILDAVEEYALVHQYGTSDYAILEAHKTVKIELVTEGIREIAQNLKQSTERLKQIETEGDFTEPEILDLREEELKG